MIHIHDAIRERMLIRDKVIDPPDPPAPLPGVTIEDLFLSEWSPEFEQLMRNRLVQGALRYGTIKANRGRKYRRVNDAIRRLNLYQETGNLEHLVDAGNLTLLEFECGSHPRKHFESIDDGEHCEIEK